MRECPGKAPKPTPITTCPPPTLSPRGRVLVGSMKSYVVIREKAIFCHKPLCPLFFWEGHKLFWRTSDELLVAHDKPEAGNLLEVFSFSTKKRWSSTFLGTLLRNGVLRLWKRASQSQKRTVSEGVVVKHNQKCPCPPRCTREWRTFMSNFYSDTLGPSLFPPGHTNSSSNISVTVLKRIVVTSHFAPLLIDSYQR